MTLYDIQISNWAEYQGRGKDHDYSHWYRQRNNFFTSAVWDALDARGKVLLWFLLQYVSNNGHKTGRVVIKKTTLGQYSDVRGTKVGPTLDILRTFGILEYQILNDAPRNVHVPRQEENRKKEEIAPLGFESQVEETDWKKEGISENLKKEINQPSPRKYEPDPTTSGTRIPDFAKEFINRCKGEPN